MNSSEDWDVIWRWQWFRRALWQPHMKDPSHPEGRTARTAPVWDWVLKEYKAERVLDCNAGLGLRTILLHESGFDAVGTERSAVAVEHARELADMLGLPIAYHHCLWADLGERFQAEFDAVINDALSWMQTRSDLRFAVHNFASVLKPGGVLIFTGADQWSHIEDHTTLIDHAWAAAPRFQLRSDYTHDDTHLTLLVARDKSDVGVVENYLFVVRDDQGARLETASICNSLRWTWPDYQAVFREAGFTKLESVKVPIGRREHVLNVATK